VLGRTGSEKERKVGSSRDIYPRGVSVGETTQGGKRSSLIFRLTTSICSSPWGKEERESWKKKKVRKTAEPFIYF